MRGTGNPKVETGRIKDRTIGLTLLCEKDNDRQNMSQAGLGRLPSRQAWTSNQLTLNGNKRWHLWQAEQAWKKRQLVRFVGILLCHCIRTTTNMTGSIFDEVFPGVWLTCMANKQQCSGGWMNIHNIKWKVNLQYDLCKWAYNFNKKRAGVVPYSILQFYANVWRGAGTDKPTTRCKAGMAKPLWNRKTGVGINYAFNHVCGMAFLYGHSMEKTALSEGTLTCQVKPITNKCE